MKILISTSSFGKHDDTPLRLLKDNGFEVLLNPYYRKMSESEIKELIVDMDGLIAGTEPLTEEVLKNANNLKTISRCGTGMDNVNLQVAKKLGIKVFNTPDAVTPAVAELTVGLMLSLLRKICRADRELRREHWQKRMGNLLFGKKVGIKGFGRVGRKVAELVKPFGCEIAYSDPFVEDGLLGLRRLSMKDLLGWADILTIHVSVSERLIGEREFLLMKKGAWIVNTSRGGVLDETVLYECLKNGYLSGAALDVFEEEPYAGPLKELDNVILTPHVGSYAREARVKMERQAVENLLKGLEK